MALQAAKKLAFDFALKGRGFTRAVNDRQKYGF